MKCSDCKRFIWPDGCTVYTDGRQHNTTGSCEWAEEREPSERERRLEAALRELRDGLVGLRDGTKLGTLAGWIEVLDGFLSGTAPAPATVPTDLLRRVLELLKEARDYVDCVRPEDSMSGDYAVDLLDRLDDADLADDCRRAMGEE